MAPGLQFVFPGSINPNGPSDLIMALGKNGQMINIVPSQNLVYIRMGDAPGVGEVPFAFNDTIWQKINSFPCPSLVQNQTSIAEFNLYPNPSNSLVNIDFANTTFTVYVYDFTGKLVAQQSNCYDRCSFSVKGFEAGIYNVKVLTKELLTQNKTLIIQ